MENIYTMGSTAVFKEKSILRSPHVPLALITCLSCEHLVLEGRAAICNLSLLTQFISDKTLSLLCRKEYTDMSPTKEKMCKFKQYQSIGCTINIGQKLNVQPATSFLFSTYVFSLVLFMQLVPKPFMFTGSSLNSALNISSQ